MEARSRENVAADAATKAAAFFKETVDSALLACEARITAAKTKIDGISNDKEHDDRMIALFNFESDLHFDPLTDTPSYKYDFKKDAKLDEFEEATRIVSGEAWKTFPDQRAAILQAATRLKAAVEQARAKASEVAKLENLADDDTTHNLWKRIEGFNAPDRLFSVLPTASYSAKTDADGKCSLDLPSGQRWMLAAMGGRDVPSNEHEGYVWIVELTTNAKNISLSNDNQLANGASPLLL